MSTKTLVLWRRHFLYKDTEYSVKAGSRVSVTVAMAIIDPESHFHLPTGDRLTRSFNCTDTKGRFHSIWMRTGSHVDYTFDGCGSVALLAIEGKVPALTARVAIEETQYAIEVNLQVSVIRTFREKALLGEFKVKKDKSERKSSITSKPFTQQVLPRTRKKLFI